MRRPIAFVLALLALVLARPAGADEPSAPAGPSASERALVKRMVDELRGEAARIRGLAWKEEVPADLLSREQLRANMLQEIAEEITPEERARDARILRRLGLLASPAPGGPQVPDHVDLMMELYVEEVGGYFDPKTKRLFLIEGMTGDAQRPVILHELIHALEDQYYDLLARTERWKDDSDRLFAEKCLFEGSAEHAREIYEAAHPEIAAESRRQQPMTNRGEQSALLRIPAYLTLPTLLHYQVGPRLVRPSVAEDYATGIGRLYDDPPVSQEQCLHPARWHGERRDYPRRVVWAADLAEVAGEGWSLVHDVTVGQLDLALHLDYFLGGRNGKLDPRGMSMGRFATPQAWTAAVGWDAGRACWLEHEGLPLVWVQVHAFDSPRDAAEAADAFADALRVAYGRAFDAHPWKGVEGGRMLAYVGAHGPGRILLRGEDVLVVDGAPPDVLGRLFEAVAATVFEVDERDAWDAVAADAPLSACVLADRARGLGVLGLGEEWTVGAPHDVLGDAPRHEAMFAAARKGSLVAQLMVLDIPGGLAELGPTFEDQLATTFPGLDVAGRQPSPMGGADGWRYPTLRGGGGGAHVRLASDGDRLLLLLVFGPLAEVAAAAEAVANAVVLLPR